MKKNIIVYIVIIVLAIALAGTTTYIIVDKLNDKQLENKPQEEDNKNEEDTKKEDIILEEDSIYLSYVPFINGSMGCANETYKDAYYGDRISINNIDKEVLLYNAYLNTQEYKFSENEEQPLIKDREGYSGYPAQVYYKVSDIKSFTNKAYNTLDLPQEVGITGGILFKQDDYYLGTFGCGGSSYYKYTSNTKSYFEDNYYVIEEQALFIENGYITYNIYGNTTDIKNQNNVIVELDNSELKAFEDFDIDNQVKDLPKTTFKHLFKKSDNGYYWYQTIKI